MNDQTVPVPNDDGIEMEPVIYCVLTCLALLANEPHRELARLSGGARVMAVQETVLSRLRGSSAAQAPLLYFSPVDYEQAVRGLSPVDLEQAVDKRLREWSPRALHEVSELLYRREQDCLALNAQAAMGAAKALADGLAEHLRQTLRLLVRINGGERFDDLPFTELLVTLLEKEARLLAELQAAPADMSYGAEIALHRRTVQWLGEALAPLGRPEFAQAPPYVDLWRAAIIAPRDRRLLERLASQQEPSVAWRDGLVVRLRARDQEQLQRDGLRVQLLYFDGSAFIGEAGELTPAQLAQRFAQRAQALAGSPAAVAQEHLASLRLDAVLTLQIVRERATSAAPILVPTLERLVERFSAADLAPAASAGGTPALERLWRAESALAHGMSFLAELARLDGRAELQERLQGYAAYKRAQLVALDALRGAKR